MTLQIDNLNGAGLRDYTSAIAAERLPKVVRKLNQPAEMSASLVGGAGFVVPVAGARVVLTLAGGQLVFTGYLTQAPAFEYLGRGEQGPLYRYDVVAEGDEALLDLKQVPVVVPFVERTAGAALRQLTQDLMGASIDVSAVQSLDYVAGYAADPQKTWSQHAAELAAQARACYRLQNGSLSFAPLGASAYALGDADPTFVPQGLKLAVANDVANNVTVIGDMEPQPYVKDYFVGDGLTYKFYLSQTPFQKTSEIILDEEYTETALSPALWTVTDPASAVSIQAAKLHIAGGTGVDGATTVQLVEQVQLGGAVVIQHGDVQFSAASSAVIGGLYPGAVSIGGCLAGFLITPNGSQSNIQAVINGVATGVVMTTASGHHYVMTTRLYSQEIFRQEQTFHSADHPAGAGYGGAAIPAQVQVVLEVHDIDPLNPATEVAPSTVLYDNLMTAPPGFCTYALINAANLECTVAFTRILDVPNACVRGALPGQAFSTLLAGDLKDGAQCTITSSDTLEFYTEYVPAADEQIEVHYRGRGRAVAWVTNPASIAEQRYGIDDGGRAAVRHVKLPLARTAADCENAALAILDDAANAAWSGEYTTWSNYLPGGAADIFPGDGLNVGVAGCGASFSAIVKEVQIEVQDLAGENSMYQIAFGQAANPALGFEFEAAKVSMPVDVTQFANSEIGSSYIADLTAAQITEATSTTMSIDAGNAPPAGGGIEVRWSDEGWGAGNNQNLIGRFTTQTFTIPRLSQIQDCYLQQYDNSTPAKYSRYSAALHVDYPL
ncbi:MAG TPA: hypothetical protein VF753_09730 [Terriglobales bacterium]